MEIKKNTSLIFAILAPILLILFIAGSIYLPGIFIQPKFNFLYTIGSDYYNRQQYGVKNGKLIENKINYPDNYINGAEAKIFIYDVINSKSEEISFQEAQAYNLDVNIISPDEFEVISGSRGGGIFPFFGSENDYNSKYIKGHNVSKRLNIQGNINYYYNFNFLGWIKI